jgi:hypothetical protein
VVDVGTTGAAGWRDDVTRVGRPVGAGFVGGAAAGFLLGGIGGRLVMLLLRLTSSDALRGVDTDDGFEIGVFSTGTFFLVVAMTVLGGVGGIVYAGARGLLPPRWRWPVAAVLAGLVGGAVVLDAEGIDFRLLDPLLLAVVAFVAMPAAWGALTSALVERRLATDRRATVLSLLPLVIFLLTGIVGVAVVVLLAASGPATRSWPWFAAAWRSPAAMWVGRAALVAVGSLALVELVDDVGAIL